MNSSLTTAILVLLYATSNPVCAQQYDYTDLAKAVSSVEKNVAARQHISDKSIQEVYCTCKYCPCENCPDSAQPRSNICTCVTQKNDTTQLLKLIQHSRNVSIVLQITGLHNN